MGRKTLVSWAHHSWNGWMCCGKCAPECIHCYINRAIRRYKDPQTGLQLKPWGHQLYKPKTTWDQPQQFQAETVRRGWRAGEVEDYARVFTCSISDFFIKEADQWRDAAWKVIKGTPNLVYMILTKRPEKILSHLPADWGQGYHNVWLGTSVGCKLTLPKIDVLREVPVHPEAVRWLSCEPLIEDISNEIDLTGIGWLIVGGESGDNPEYHYDPNEDWRLKILGQNATQAVHGRRVMELEWAYKMMLRARRADIPFWFKQITAGHSGVMPDALGKMYHEVPPPPHGGIWLPYKEKK